MEDNDHKMEPDPLAEATKAIGPITLSAEDWTVLEPHFMAWRKDMPRMESINREMKRLSSEAKMINAVQEFFRDRFWDEVAKLHPETKDQCMHYKDDDGKRIVQKCGGGTARVIDVDASKLPPHLRALLRGLTGMEPE